MRFLDRVKAALERDRELPVRVLAKKGVRMVWSLATAKAWFAACTKVGRSPRAQGKPYIENLGEIVIGDDFNLSSQFVTSHLVTGPKGRIHIGNQVNINYGAGICSHAEIHLGDRVRIGPYAMILDTDFHTVGDLDEASAPKPVFIGDDVWLANRVTVLRGARIGAGSVITAGSVVAGEIPPGVIAGGNPARVIRRVDAAETPTVSKETAATLRPLAQLDAALVSAVQQVFVNVFHLSTTPALTAGSREVTGWDSLGHLQLVTALEGRFGVAFGADLGSSLDSVGACAQWIDALRTEAPKPVSVNRAWTMTVHGALADAASTRGAAPAVICDDVPTSYEALLSRVAGLSEWLAGQGVTAGERVLLCVDDKVDFIATYYAVVSLCAVVVPLHEATVRATVFDTAKRCHATRVVVDRTAKARLGAEQLAPLVVTEVDAAPRKTRSLADSVARLKSSSVSPDDVAALMFTSGTTMRKAVVLTHRNLMQAALNIATFMDVTDAVREYVTVPLSHSFGWGRVRVVLSSGGTLVVQNGPLRAGRVVAAVEAQRCTALSAVPAGVALLEAAGDTVMQRLGAQLRLVEMGSAVFTPERKKRLSAAWPNARLCMHYGLTEASRSTFLDFRADVAHLGSVGRATPGCQVSVRDAEGRVLPVGEAGEVVIHGAHVAKGYLDDPERTARTFLPDGGMRTGDQGFLDAEGYLHFAGRLDEQINHGGLKVSPTEVEEALRPTLGALEYCVVGVKDPAGIVGEIVTLAVVKGGAVPTIEQLATSMVERLESYKVPRQVVVVDALPRTANGKLQRLALKQQLERVSAS